MPSSMALSEYVVHYHRERNQQGRENQLLHRPPLPVRPDPTYSGGMRRRPIKRTLRDVRRLH